MFLADPVPDQLCLSHCKNTVPASDSITDCMAHHFLSIDSCIQHPYQGLLLQYQQPVISVLPICFQSGPSQYPHCTLSSQAGLQEIPALPAGGRKSRVSFHITSVTHSPVPDSVKTRLLQIPCSACVLHVSRSPGVFCQRQKPCSLPAVSLITASVRPYDTHNLHTLRRTFLRERRPV